MSKRLCVLLVSGVALVGEPALADERYFALTIAQALAGSVNSDIDESETIPDYYKDYNLEADRGFELRLLFGDLNGGGLYVSAGSLRADDSENIARHSFDNISIGGSLATTIPYMDVMDGYGRISLGLGASRFDSSLEQDRKTHALAEVQLEMGMVFYERLALGIGGKLQYIGHPTETIAVAVIPQMSVSLWL